jgi:hypothetical protein
MTYAVSVPSSQSDSPSPPSSTKSDPAPPGPAARVHTGIEHGHRHPGRSRELLRLGDAQIVVGPRRICEIGIGQRCGRRAGAALCEGHVRPIASGAPRPDRSTAERSPRPAARSAGRELAPPSSGRPAHQRPLPSFLPVKPGHTGRCRHEPPGRCSGHLALAGADRVLSQYRTQVCVLCSHVVRIPPVCNRRRDHPQFTAL